MEGLTVSALVNRRILLVGTYKDTVQGAVIGIIAMMDTLLNGTLDALISMTAHFIPLLL